MSDTKAILEALRHHSRFCAVWTKAACTCGTDKPQPLAGVSIAGPTTTATAPAGPLSNHTDGTKAMNATEADDAVTEAIQHREEATRILERAQTAAHVANTNLGFAERHYDAAVRLVADRERVLRELTIAQEGGYRP